MEADGDYAVISEEAILPDERSQTVSISEVPLAMTRGEGRQTVERWLSEARVARDTARFTLPPSKMAQGAGDVVSLPEEGGRGLFRIDRVEQMGLAQRVEAVRIEPESYVPIELEDMPTNITAFSGPVPVTPLFLDLPLLTGDEVPHAPHVAVTAKPWPGSAALYASVNGSNYRLDTLIELPAAIGITQTPLLAARPGLPDRGAPLRVRMLNGRLESVARDAFLAGGNLCAIGDGSPDGWELLQFQNAELVAPDTYDLSLRLRGQAGTEAAMQAIWPEGSVLVRIDASVQQTGLRENALGLERFYKIGPGDRPLTDPAYQGLVQSFDGIGLRPYSPAHLRVRRLAGGDLAISWIRRTRKGGDRWDIPEVPLSEESESYLVRVVQNDQVIREQIVTQPSWTYGAGAQSADGLIGFYGIKVAQISASFGPGPFAGLTLAG